MNKIAPLLVSLALIGGCSSGGGTTSSGDGVGSNTTESNLLLTASLAPADGIVSVDAFRNECVSATPNEEGLFEVVGIEPALTTKLGTLTITSRDLVDSSGLTPVEFFPEGITFNQYRVSFTSPNSFAPPLEDRVFKETFVLPNGTSTGSFTVVLLDLDVILAQFQSRSSMSIASYNVRVTANGQEFNGSPISVSADTFIEVGNFDLCGGM